jgi:hypothetical protein
MDCEISREKRVATILGKFNRARTGRFMYTIPDLEAWLEANHIKMPPKSKRTKATLEDLVLENALNDFMSCDLPELLGSSAKKRVTPIVPASAPTPAVPASPPFYVTGIFALSGFFPGQQIPPPSQPSNMFSLPNVSIGTVNFNFNYN